MSFGGSDLVMPWLLERVFFFWWLSKIAGHPKMNHRLGPERDDRLNPQVKGNTVQCSCNILLFGITFIHVDEVQIYNSPTSQFLKGNLLAFELPFRVTSYK